MHCTYIKTPTWEITLFFRTTTCLIGARVSRRSSLISGPRKHLIGWWTITHCNDCFDITPINNLEVSTTTSGAACLHWLPPGTSCYGNDPNDHHCGNSCSRSNSWLVQPFHAETKGREGEEEGRAGGSPSSAVRQDMHLCLVKLLSKQFIHLSISPLIHLSSLLFCPCVSPSVSCPFSPLYSHLSLFVIASFSIDNWLLNVLLKQMDFQSHKYTDRYHPHNYSPLSLALSLLRFTLCSSRNTEMPALTILINPAVIHPKAKQKRIWFSSTPAFHHIFHSPALASAILYIFSTLSTSVFPSLYSFTVHTIIFSSYPFTPLNVSTSPSLTLIIHSPISYPLRLTYQSPALPLCQHLPPGLRAAHVPPWARALREPEILMATGEGHLRHTLQGVQARAAVTLSQSGWTSVKRTGLPRQMEARWREANEEKWWSMYVCV